MKESAEPQSLGQTLITKYLNSKAAMIRKLAGSIQLYEQETGFLDDGIIEARIDRLKEECESITKELTQITKYGDIKNQADQVKFQALAGSLADHQLQIASLAANNFAYLEQALNMVSDIRDCDFTECILALRAYQEGDQQEAFKLFYAYFKDKDYLLEHYLINKVYGSILLRLGQTSMAGMLLRKAVEKRPEDYECHKLLLELYQTVGNTNGIEVQKNILQVLGVSGR